MSSAFTTGQQVRLTVAYYGKPLNQAHCLSIFDLKPMRVLPAGMTFTVLGPKRNGEQRVKRRLDGPTVLLRNADGTFCIPARLLELVPSDNGSSVTTQSKESGRDAEGDRVG